MSQVAVDNGRFGRGVDGLTGLASQKLLEGSEVSLRRLRQLGVCERRTVDKGRWTVGQ